MLVNQGLLGIAFFEATAFIVLLVLFLIFQRDHINKYFRFWVAGWLCFTSASLCEVAMLGRGAARSLWLAVVIGRTVALLLFSAAVVRFTTGAGKRVWSDPAARGSRAVWRVLFSAQRRAELRKRAMGHNAADERHVPVDRNACYGDRRSQQSGHGVRLLGGIFVLSGLHGMDRHLVDAAAAFLACA